MVQDPGALASLHENLSTQLAKMQQCKPSEDGLVLEGGDSKSYTRTNQKTRSKTLTAVEKKCRAELPKRSTKTKHTGRVGKNAAINRKTYRVHVPICSTARAKPSYITATPSPKSVRTEGTSSANEEKQPETEKTQEEPKEGHTEHENNQGKITKIKKNTRTNQNRRIPRNKTSR